MPGLLDEVMDGIAAKEKQAPPPQTPPPAQTPPEGGQTTPPAQGGKGMHEYGDAFKKKYGERKKT